MSVAADSVLLTLLLREQNTVWIPIGELADECDLTDSQVRRALRELRQDGRILPAGKRGNTTGWSFPDDDSEARSAATSPETTSPEGGPSVPGGRSAERLTEPATPTAPVARPDDGEPTGEEAAELRRLGLAHCYSILDHVYDDLLGQPDLPAGECGECDQEARRRYRLGRFALCRDCRLRRLRAKQQLEAAAAVLEIDLPTIEPAPEPVEIAALPDAEVVLLERARDRRNGNTPNPLWDDPDF
ncbi:MAG TPA: hypothetical protein VKB54_06985 [Solirubrobacteraceae bacterium]|nr:hypothetical protein [Solirubrobacteraceae bacterium]